MIVRLDSRQLRSLADQIDALSLIEAAGGRHTPANTVIEVDGRGIAYAAWVDDDREYRAEITSFTPGSAKALDYHDHPQA